MKRAGAFQVVALTVMGVLLLPMTDLEGQTSLPQTQPQQVRMSLIVADRSNRSIDNVREGNIQITQDGQPVTLSFFGKDERPLRCVVAVDNSGSFHSLLGAGVNVTRAVINNKKPDDEMMIVRFVSSDKIHFLQEFTTDSALLLASLQGIGSEGGQTALVDAVYLAVKAAAARQANNPGTRGTVVLITDGEDRSSYYSQNQLVKLLRETEVQIFIIGVMVRLDREPGLIRPSPRHKAEKLLHELAKESGGKVFFPKNDAELTEATMQIVWDLKTQYLIGFDRQPRPGEKGLQKIKVSVVNDPQAKNLVAITRPGYLVGSSQPAKSSKSH